jgi:hypothetical protein
MVLGMVNTGLVMMCFTRMGSSCRPIKSVQSDKNSLPHGGSLREAFMHVKDINATLLRTGYSYEEEKCQLAESFPVLFFPLANGLLVC